MSWICLGTLCRRDELNPCTPAALLLTVEIRKIVSKDFDMVNERDRVLTARELQELQAVVVKLFVAKITSSRYFFEHRALPQGSDGPTPSDQAEERWIGSMAG